MPYFVRGAIRTLTLFFYLCHPLPGVQTSADLDIAQLAVVLASNLKGPGFKPCRFFVLFYVCMGSSSKGLIPKVFFISKEQYQFPPL